MKEIKKEQEKATYYVAVNDKLRITQDHNVTKGVLLRIKNKYLNLTTKKYDQIELGVYPNHLYFNYEGSIEVLTPIRWVKNVMKNTYVIINNYIISYNITRKENGGFYYDVELKKLTFSSCKEREDLM